MRPDPTSAVATAVRADFDRAVEAFRLAQRAYVKGDPQPALDCFSQRDDVTLANPIGPPRRGPADVAAAGAQAAAHLSDGSVRGYDEVSRYSTPDLGYVVQIERVEARLDGSENMRPMALRATLIFRREDGIWKIAHRHADPITAPRPIQSIAEP